MTTKHKIARRRLTCLFLDKGGKKATNFRFTTENNAIPVQYTSQNKKTKNTPRISPINPPQNNKF
jgi:hypothetical protein